MITSHEYAWKMIELANWLLERPEFEAHWQVKMDLFPGNKDEFLKAVRAIGSGSKRIVGKVLVFAPKTPEGTELNINITQSSVCRLVKPAIYQSQLQPVEIEPAEYECEPLLSPQEIEQL